MRALVTGVAGFIGSHLAEALVERGDAVVGIDCFTPYYARCDKEANLASLRETSAFSLLEADIATETLPALLEGIDVVFHQAAQPGVRASWEAFDQYVDMNVRATQCLLDAARSSGVRRFVYASSSSVYGNVSAETTEDELPQPFSPYGVTKLAAEHLCSLYAANWDVPTTSLRYFSVYGPRQRPDMAIHRLIEATLTGDPFPFFGSGEQVRDFTFVSDVVAANLAAAEAEAPPGTVCNIAGGSAASLNDLVALVEKLTSHSVPLDRQPHQPGDVDRTGGSIERATRLLGWAPQVSLEDGITSQMAWHLARHGISA